MNGITTFTVSLNSEEFAVIEKFRAEKAKKDWANVLLQISMVILGSRDDISETFEVDYCKDFLDHSEFNRGRFEDCLTSLGFHVNAYERSWMQISRI